MSVQISTFEEIYQDSLKMQKGQHKTWTLDRDLQSGELGGLTHRVNTTRKDGNAVSYLRSGRTINGHCYNPENPDERL